MLEQDARAKAAPGKLEKSASRRRFSQSGDRFHESILPPGGRARVDARGDDQHRGTVDGRLFRLRRKEAWIRRGGCELFHDQVANEVQQELWGAQGEGERD
jgi:hypothetical protein